MMIELWHGVERREPMKSEEEDVEGRGSCGGDESGGSVAGRKLWR
jgi:hypothetical protein